MKNIRLGEVLVQSNVISQEQLDIALEVQKTDRGKRLGDLLIEYNYVTENQLIGALSKRLQHPIIDFKTHVVDIQAVEKIPKSLSMKYNILASQMNNDRLTLVVREPLDLYAIEDIKSIVDMPCDIVLCTKAEITNAIHKAYAEVDALKSAKRANINAGESQFSVEEIDVNQDDTPVVTLINTMLIKGESTGASDIHIEPFEEETMIRMRIDGQLTEYLKISATLHQSIIARIKILSELNIAEKRVPQDGQFRVRIIGVYLNIRVSIMPTVFGEKAVLRFLGQTSSLDHAGQFGMNKQNYEKIQRILENPHGIIYITGPTGSGKTTTLYMMIEELSKRPVNISTVEDPVERNLERINQTQVNNTAGLTFAAGLRALLRQDPDVIMLGETRDNETASIAVSAAITGHLVLSTLHTNDAISSLVRLSNMGIENFLIASALVGIVAQRLVKKICPDCIETYTPSLKEKEYIGNITQLHKGRGCHNCNYTGYKGRIAIHEVLEIDKNIRLLIEKREPSETIYSYVRENDKLTTLHTELLQLVKQGVTTVEELIKLTSHGR